MRLTRYLMIGSLMAIVGLTFVQTTAGQENDCGPTVTVQDGDTLLDIADRCGTTVAALLAENPEITNPNVLRIGQALTLPTANNAIDPIVALSQQAGGPGSRVIVVANGFPANRDVSITMGPAGAIAEISLRGRTNIFGGLTETLVVPQNPDLTNPRWQVTVTDLERGIRETSLPFFITTGPPVGGVIPTDVPREEPPTTPDVVLPPIEQTPQARFTQTQVYLIDTSGDQFCLEPTAPVTVNIAPTVAPLTAAIESMLNTEDYGVNNLYNAFSLSDLSLSGIDIEDRTATIALSGELITLGNCDLVWMPTQIRQTALQYDTIDRVEILVNGQPIEALLNRAGDG